MMCIICLILGIILGFIFAAICTASKVEDEKMKIENENLQNYFTKSIGDIKLDNHKSILKKILKSDIELYQRLYQKSNNTYYSGRIHECQFILEIIEGRNKTEHQ